MDSLLPKNKKITFSFDKVFFLLRTPQKEFKHFYFYFVHKPSELQVYEDSLGHSMCR